HAGLQLQRGGVDRHVLLADAEETAHADDHGIDAAVLADDHVIDLANALAVRVIDGLALKVAHPPRTRFRNGDEGFGGSRSGHLGSTRLWGLRALVRSPRSRGLDAVSGVGR